MKDYSTVFTNTTGGVFPGTLGVNASGPSATDGTEFVKLMIDDIWGARQDLMVEAGKTPSGNDEAVGSSDFVAALKSLLWFNNLITGLVPSNNVTDSDHDIDVSVGQAMDSSNAFLMKLAAGLIKQIDASWAVGTNAGGLFTGAVANNTWYHTFLIRKDSDGSIDAGFDTSITAANIPGGYTAFRRIGSVLTDGSANILGFTPTELAGGSVDVEYKAVISELAASASIAARTLLAVSVPPNQIAKMSAEATYQSSNTLTWIKSANYTDAIPVNGNADIIVISLSEIEMIIKEIAVDSSSQIAYRSTTAGGVNLDINTQGYIDRRV